MVMSILIKGYISLEKLARDPVGWFAQQPWWLRLVLAILIIPLISASSIVGYLWINQGSSTESLALLKQNAQEIVDLKKDLETSQSAQMEEIGQLSIDLAKLRKILATSSAADDSLNDEAPPILGDQTSIDLASGSGDIVPRPQVLYLPKNSDQIKVFERPAVSSKIIKNLDSDSLHFYLQKTNGWYQIDIGEGKVGWIPEKSVVVLP